MTNTAGAPSYVFHWLGFGWQGETEACAARRIVGSPQTATMRFNDGAADAKSHAGPVGLGCKEGVEDLFCLLRGQPYAGIAHGEQKSLIFRSLRLDGKLPGSVHLFQSFDAVDHEVHQDLL